MAVARLSAFADTTEQTVSSVAAYLSGVFVYNPARTATDGWIEIWNAANPTPGTTEPDVILYIPFAASNRDSFRFNFPRILFGTAITAFFNDTSPLDVSAWNGSAATGYYVDVYYTVA